MPKGGLEPPRVTSHAPQTCASASSATSALSCQITIYFCGDFFGSGVVAGVGLFAPGFPSGLTTGEAAGTGKATVAGVADGEDDGCGDGDGTDCDSSTECEPLITGSERINAMSMNAAAAPIVILARMLCVPRGPNAVLETLLVNKAPASAFPGCKSTTTTSTTQARINSPYKI